jgi:NitT/TauT family transport system substrate-binding protein
MRVGRVLRRAALALALCLPLALSACNGDEDPEPTETPVLAELHMGMVPAIGYGPWFIADYKGYLAAEGIDLDIQRYATQDEMIAAFEAGDIDLLNVPASTALELSRQDYDFRIILLEASSVSAHAIVTSSDEITSIRDIKGARVAFEKDSAGHILLMYALSQHGMSMMDIEAVEMTSSEAAAALLAGTVTVAALAEPDITNVRAELAALLAQPTPTPAEGEAAPETAPLPAAITSLYQAGTKDGLISDVLIARGRVLDRQSEDIRHLLRAWDQAVQFYCDNEFDGRAIISRNVGVATADVRPVYNGIVYYDLAQNRTELKGDFLWATLPAINDAAISAGLMTGTVDPTTIVNDLFVSE